MDGRPHSAPGTRQRGFLSQREDPRLGQEVSNTVERILETAASCPVLRNGLRVAKDDPPGTPASTNVSGADYPRVLLGRRVIFRVSAPDAHEIQFKLDKPYVAVRDATGPGPRRLTHRSPASIIIDVDRQRAGQRSSERNVLWVRPGNQRHRDPEEGADFSAPRDVLHGEVRECWYQAKTTGEWRRIFVYTPPGYDPDRSGRYPVLYLQHGRARMSAAGRDRAASASSWTT